MTYSSRTPQPQRHKSTRPGRLYFLNLYVAAQVVWLVASLFVVAAAIIICHQAKQPERSPIAVSASGSGVIPRAETGAGESVQHTSGVGAPAPPESLAPNEVYPSASLGGGDSPLKQVVVTPPDNTPIACLPDELLSSGGVAPVDYGHARAIIFRESTCNYEAVNSSSGALGYCQAMPSVHDLPGDYATDELVQLKWCHNYALRRYGSWAKAWSFWQANKWW